MVCCNNVCANCRCACAVLFFPGVCKIFEPVIGELQVDHVLGNVTFVQTFFSAQEEEDCYNWRGLLQFYRRGFEKKFADMTFIYWLWVCSNGIHLVILRSAAIPGGSLAVPIDLRKEGRSVAHILAKDWKQHPSTMYSICHLLPDYRLLEVINLVEYHD